MKEAKNILDYEGFILKYKNVPKKDVRIRIPIEDIEFIKENDVNLSLSVHLLINNNRQLIDYLKKEKKN